MPSKQQLSAIKVKNIKEPGYFLDSDGLYLQVSSTGTKSWVYRFMLKKRRRDMGLGPLDTLSLADARLQRNEQKKFVKQGIDPIANRTTIENQQIAQEQIKQRESITFKLCAEEYISSRQAEWKSPKSSQQWMLLKISPCCESCMENLFQEILQSKANYRGDFHFRTCV